MPVHTHVEGFAVNIPACELTAAATMRRTTMIILAEGFLNDRDN